MAANTHPADISPLSPLANCREVRIDTDNFTDETVVAWTIEAKAVCIIETEQITDAIARICMGADYNLGADMRTRS